MPDAAPLTPQEKLIAALQERDNVGATLHAEADRFIELGNFEQAAKCAHTSMILAQQAGDTYAHGASQFHLGLAYFVLRDGDWDRAANLCKDAALIFHTADPKRAEGVAYYAAARISLDACERGLDRWEAALESALRALMLLQEVPDLSRTAHDFFNRLNKRYTEHLAATVSAPTPPPEQSPPPATPDPVVPAANPTPVAEPPPPEQAVPQEKTKPRPLGRRLSNPPRARLDLWTKILAAMIVSYVTVFGALAGLGIRSVLIELPVLGYSFIAGIVIVFAATFLLYSFLKLMGQIDFWGKRNVVAIVIDTTDGRIWTFEDEAHHWLVPFRQHLAAWLPTNARPIERFTPGATAPGQRGVAAYLTMKIRVADAGLVWDRIAGTLTPIVRWGIPFPMRVEDTEGRLDEYAGRRAVEYLDNLAQSLPGVDDKTLAQFLLKWLRQDVGSIGIFYSELRVKRY